MSKERQIFAKQQLLKNITFEKERLEKFKKESSMDLVEIITHLRKQVGFYRLYLALDEVERLKQVNKSQNEKIEQLQAMVIKLCEQRN